MIVAYGFRANPAEWLKEKVATDESDRIVAKDADGYRTSRAHYYAGGDMVRGADLVVTAIADGRKAALSICEDLGVLV